MIVRIVNPSDAEMTFILEPWGETYPMPPHAEFVITGSGPEGDGPEIACTANVVTVWGWPGSVLRVFHREVELGPAGVARPPMPGPASGGRAR